jgi:hypothetical protein
MSGRRVTLQIDQLVLRGLSPGDQRTVEAALRAELARTLAAAGSLGGSMRTPVMRLAPLTPGVSGRALGTELGRTLAKGIKP